MVGFPPDDPPHPGGAASHAAASWSRPRCAWSGSRSAASERHRPARWCNGASSRRSDAERSRRGEARARAERGRRRAGRRLWHQARARAAGRPRPRRWRHAVHGSHLADGGVHPAASAARRRSAERHAAVPRRRGGDRRRHPCAHALLLAARLPAVDHWGFDGRVHRGELVVQRRYAAPLLRVLASLFADRFPIARMRLVDAYRGDDDLSVAANNTSAFNCRPVAGTSHWSEHAYGRAIDLNPVQNPYVTAGGRVTPPAAGPYADRSRRAPGTIHGGDATVRAFASIGWGWGGLWHAAKDYQHFSASGR